MRVIIEHIPTEGQDIRVDARSPWAVEAAGRALEAEVRGLEGALRVVRKGHTVLVTGSFAADSVRMCERCGEDVSLHVVVEPDLRYVPEPDPEAEDEVELEGDQLDVGFYEGVDLSMPDVVCEALSLALPPRIACEDVPACDKRTADLLAAKGSSGSPTHPGLAALKNLR